MNPKYIWGLIGVGLGAAGGYFFAKRQFEKKHEEYIHDKVQQGIEAFIEATMENAEENASDVTVSEIYPDGSHSEHEAVDYASFYHKPSPKELMRMSNQQMAESEHPEDSGEDTDFESQEEKDERLDAELQGDKRMHDKPFEITEDDYAEQNHYDKEVLYWYDTDSTLATEGDEVIEEPMSLVGDLLDRFDDPNLVGIFVRNPKYATDYNVIQIHEAFTDRLNSDPDWAD